MKGIQCLKEAGEICFKNMIERKLYSFVLLLGCILFSVAFIMDLIVYPGFIRNLLYIRIFVILSFILAIYLFYILPKKYHLFVMQSAIFIAAASITGMCYITGEGFASPYYAGIFSIIMSSSVFITLNIKRYAIYISILMAQHFIWLMFLPYTLRDIIINIVFLIAVIALGLLIHYLIWKMINEIKKLKGLLPICSKCKNIRDDDGYWKEIESYISTRTNAEFTHGICPKCAKELYGFDPLAMSNRLNAYPHRRDNIFG